MPGDLPELNPEARLIDFMSVGAGFLHFWRKMMKRNAHDQRHLVAVDRVDHQPDDQRPLTVAVFLQEWLGGKQSLRPSTHLSYETHVRLYFVPHLGALALPARAPPHRADVPGLGHRRGSPAVGADAQADPPAPACTSVRHPRRAPSAPCSSRHPSPARPARSTIPPIATAAGSRPSPPRSAPTSSLTRIEPESRRRWSIFGCRALFSFHVPPTQARRCGGLVHARDDGLTPSDVGGRL